MRCPKGVPVARGFANQFGDCSGEVRYISVARKLLQKVPMYRVIREYHRKVVSTTRRRGGRVV